MASLDPPGQQQAGPLLDEDRAETDDRVPLPGNLGEAPGQKPGDGLGFQPIEVEAQGVEEILGRPALPALDGGPGVGRFARSRLPEEVPGKEPIPHQIVPGHPVVVGQAHLLGQPQVEIVDVRGDPAPPKRPLQDAQADGRAPRAGPGHADQSYPRIHNRRRLPAGHPLGRRLSGSWQTMGVPGGRTGSGSRKDRVHDRDYTRPAANFSFVLGKNHFI